MTHKLTPILVALLLVGTTAFAVESAPNAAQWVGQLGDSKLTQNQRNAAASSLAGLGKDAMPTLIAALHDNRVFYPNYESSSTPNGPTVNVNLTVGLECNYILMNIISNGASAKGVGFRYKVLNWPDWWSQHKDMSQVAIQKEVKKRNDWILQSTGKGDSIPHINQP